MTVARLFFSGLIVVAIGLGIATYAHNPSEPFRTRVIVFSPDYVVDPTREIPLGSDISRRADPPISFNDFLSYSFRMSEMNKKLSDTYRGLLDQDIKLNSSASSYVGQRSMVIITTDVIYIQVYEDMATILTRDEIFAYAAHEVGHIVLNHYEIPSLGGRNLGFEIAADVWAVSRGVDPIFMISALNKLKSEETEREARIRVLNAYLSTN